MSSDPWFLEDRDRENDRVGPRDHVEKQELRKIRKTHGKQR